MNYIGSKKKLCTSFIPDAVREVCGKDLSEKTFCDLFAGTGAVGRTFRNSCGKTIASDMELYSYVLNRNYIQTERIDRADKLIADLNREAEKGLRGFIYENYSEGGSAERLYFSSENGMRIDAARTAVERWRRERKISPDEYYFLLTSLLASADRVANVPAVYASFLKKLKTSARKTLEIQGEIPGSGGAGNRVYRADANELVKKISGDILYLDPPYNHRQYGAYYHILNTIAEYRPFKPRGVTGMRDYGKSLYCAKGKAEGALAALVRDARFRWIFLSYSNEGIISQGKIKEIFKSEGRYTVFQTRYQRFKQDSAREAKAECTTEYLHVLDKGA